MDTQLKSTDAIPGGRALPFIGEFFGLLRWKEIYLNKQHERLGNVFKCQIFGRKFILFVSPEANRFVLKEAADRLSAREGWKQLEPILTNDMLLLQDGAEHRTSRRLILPVFHHQAIASYFETMQAIVSDTVADWGKQGTIDLDRELRKLTLTVAVRIFLGSENRSDLVRVRDLFATMMANMNRVLFAWDLPFTNYGRGLAARREIVTYVRKFIHERQQKGDLDDAKDVLGLLLHTVYEDGRKFTETQIINQAIGFLFAAHETTSTLMDWVIFELGNRPEWREKLRTEYQQIIGNNSIQIQHLRQLTNTTNILKEGERLYPPVPFLFRGVTTEIEFGGYKIPSGWTIGISPSLCHRLPELYREPDRFDPDRFAAPREEDKQHPFALVGFGGGVHSCIGMEFAQMEMKLILINLLQNYDWTVSPSMTEMEYPVTNPIQIQTKLKAKLI
jgi:retinoid hydroxylase